MWMLLEQGSLCTSPNEECGPLANNAPLLFFSSPFFSHLFFSPFVGFFFTLFVLLFFFTFFCWFFSCFFVGMVAVE